MSRKLFQRWPGWRQWLPSFKRHWYMCVCFCVWEEIKKPMLFHASQLKHTGKKCWLWCTFRAGDKSAAVCLVRILVWQFTAKFNVPLKTTAVTLSEVIWRQYSQFQEAWKRGLCYPFQSALFPPCDSPPQASLVSRWTFLPPHVTLAAVQNSALCNGALSPGQKIISTSRPHHRLFLLLFQGHLIIFFPFMSRV